jgi:acyl carrier protein
MNIEERVRLIVSRQVKKPLEQVRLSSILSRDLGADSMDETEILSCLEEEFGLELLQNLQETVRTVGDIVSMITRLLADIDSADATA